MESLRSEKDKNSTTRSNQLVTQGDLESFKVELLTEIKDILRNNRSGPAKRWFKTNELRKIFPISPGKLHSLRVNGQLKFARVGGDIYYHWDDIELMFRNSKSHV
jgi:hypothetical protein